jgi:hypothetical protein
MNTEEQKILHAKLNMDTSRIAWKELQRFFASGAAVEVSSTLDLIEVALQMQADNKAQVEQWLASGLLAKVSDQQASSWLATDTIVWAVVVSPWVLIQEIRNTPVH